MRISPSQKHMENLQTPDSQILRHTSEINNSQAYPKSPRAVGIIAEYNPFHLGHAYQIQKARELSGADYVIVAMSGDFIQRGAPAVLDKYIRTEMALLGGADLVLELPNAFATSSAEDFAACGVALLDRLGVVDSLCFGSEWGDAAAFELLASCISGETKMSAETNPANLLNEPNKTDEISNKLNNPAPYSGESEEYSRELKAHLREGLSFPAAREAALRTVLSHLPDGDELAGLLESPNNILALEYCKAIQKRGSQMKPLTVKRMGMGYHETAADVENFTAFHSATSIRKMLAEYQNTCQQNASAGMCEISTERDADLSADTSSSESELQTAVPEFVYPFLKESHPLFADDLTLPLNYTLLSHSLHSEDLSVYADVSSELKERLQNCLLSPASFEERIFQLKTKQYTYTRISRALLHILLGLGEEDLKIWKSPEVDFAPYARVLGFRKTAAPLLKEIKKRSSIPLITKPKDASNVLSPDALRLFEQDMFASHFYQATVSAKYEVPAKNEYQAGRNLLGYSKV